MKSSNSYDSSTVMLTAVYTVECTRHQLTPHKIKPQPFILSMHEVLCTAAAVSSYLYNIMTSKILFTLALQFMSYDYSANSKPIC